MSNRVNFWTKCQIVKRTDLQTNKIVPLLYPFLKPTLIKTQEKKGKLKTKKKKLIYSNYSQTLPSKFRFSVIFVWSVATCWLTTIWGEAARKKNIFILFLCLYIYNIYDGLELLLIFYAYWLLLLLLSRVFILFHNLIDCFIFHIVVYFQ